jgi:hypothetical protein
MAAISSSVLSVLSVLSACSASPAPRPEHPHGSRARLCGRVLPASQPCPSYRCMCRLQRAGTAQRRRRHQWRCTRSPRPRDAGRGSRPSPLAVQVWHMPVHDHHVRLESDGRHDRRITVRSLAHDLAAQRRDHLDEQAPKRRRVVSDHDSHGPLRGHLDSTPCATCASTSSSTPTSAARARNGARSSIRSDTRATRSWHVTGPCPEWS